MNNTIKICLLFISTTTVGMMRYRQPDELIIRAKEVKEKPVWVADVEATTQLAAFLEEQYLTPGLCYKIDGQVVINGTTVLWDEEIWDQFAELLQKGAHCKGALALLAVKLCDFNRISKECKRTFFADIVKHYLTANPDQWNIIENGIACQCARYNYLTANDE